MNFYTFLPKLLNMSFTASIAIVCVLIVRLLLKKAPKVISYALWMIVLFRLLCPISIESQFSLFGLMDVSTLEVTPITSSMEYVPENVVHMEYPKVAIPVPGVSEIVNVALPQGEEQLRAEPLEAPIAIGTYIWMIGVLIMAIYSVISYVRLRRRLWIVSPLKQNIYLADDIPTPFVMGLICPKIYIPSDMEKRQLPYIILHEKHHIRRGDHIFKALAFLALSIHWFNPLVWVAFIYVGKDMEMSCDEAVVKIMGKDILADYTASLLSIATGKTIVAGMPLAFGEGDTKGRIHNLAHWKKPVLGVVLAAIIVCAALGIGLVTNPKEEDSNDKHTVDLKENAANGSYEEDVKASETVDSYYDENFPEVVESESSTISANDESILYVWPTKSTTISTIYGERMHPITGEKEQIDYVGIVGKEGDPVYAVSHGTIREVGFDDTLGGYLVLATITGEEVTYGHLSGSKVPQGAEVKAGQIELAPMTCTFLVV